MKTIIFTLIAFITFGLSAQQTEEAEDTTRFRVGETEFIIINHGGGASDTLLLDGESDDNEDYCEDNDLTYWSGFDFGVNTLLNTKQGTTFNNQIFEIDPAQSFNFSFRSRMWATIPLEVLPPVMRFLGYILYK